MNGSPYSNSSRRQLISPINGTDGSVVNNLILRDPSTISANDIKFPKLLENDVHVDEQTLMQVEFINDKLLRKAHRSELASKNTCLTRRWQTALTISLVLLGLGIGIGKFTFLIDFAFNKKKSYYFLFLFERWSRLLDNITKNNNSTIFTLW